MKIKIDAIGAGDRVSVWLCFNETEEYTIYHQHGTQTTRQLTKIRKDGTLKYLRPDGKTQVTVECDEAGKPIRIDAVVLYTA